MTEAKPIFIVGVPALSQEGAINMSNVLERRMPDYHILVFRLSHDKENHFFQAFFPKDFNDVDFEEFKQIVYSQMGKEI